MHFGNGLGDERNGMSGLKPLIFATARTGAIFSDDTEVIARVGFKMGKLDALGCAFTIGRRAGRYTRARRYLHRISWLSPIRRNNGSVRRYR